MKAKLRYGVSYWLRRFPKARTPAYPRHRGDLSTDVAIVGGGSTGCMCAYAFAAAGVKVSLFEAGRVGHGATSSSTALLMQEPDVDFHAIDGLYGRRAARRIWRATRRAMLEMGATLRRLNIRCGLAPLDSIYFTASPDAVRALQKEYALRREAGFEAVWLNAAKLRQVTSLEAVGGIRTRGNAQVDPYRASVGWAAAAVERGASVFERSPVSRIRARRKVVEIRTSGGLVTAERVIVATDAPTRLFTPLARHFRLMDTYVVLTPELPAAVRRELGNRDAMLWDTEQPYHYLRWTADDRIMFGGADQAHVTARRREAVIRQRAGQLMYELSRLYPVISGIQPEYAWEGSYATTADGLPFIGPHRNYPRHLFALGLGGNGMATGFLAARLLLRAHLDESAKGDELFGFTR